MNRLGRPLVYGLLVVLAIVAAVLSGQDAPPPSKSAAPKKLSSTDARASNEFDHLDYVARFDRPKLKPRNLFVPLIETKGSSAVLGVSDIDHIPADFAHGEANWIFTGLAEVDGVRMALLENSQSRQGGFVKEGETWKTCRVESITSESIVLLDSQGEHQVVMRFNPNKPPKEAVAAANAGLQPVTVGPGMTGPIGPNGPSMEIHALPPAFAAGSRVTHP